MPAPPDLPPDPPRRGFRRRYLNEKQRAELLARVRKGQGRHTACGLLGITDRQLRNTIEASPQFRRELAIARREADEVLEEIAYAEAVKRGGDVQLLKFMIQRRDQAKQLNRGRRDKLEAQARREAGGDKPEVLAAVAATAGLFINDFPPDKLGGVMLRLKQLIGEAAGDPDDDTPPGGFPPALIAPS